MSACVCVRRWKIKPPTFRVFYSLRIELKTINCQIKTTKSNYLCVSSVFTWLWLRWCCIRVLKLNCLFVSRKFSCDLFYFLFCILGCSHTAATGQFVWKYMQILRVPSWIRATNITIDWFQTRIHLYRAKVRLFELFHFDPIESNRMQSISKFVQVILPRLTRSHEKPEAK